MTAFEKTPCRRAYVIFCRRTMSGRAVFIVSNDLRTRLVFTVLMSSTRACGEAHEAGLSWTTSPCVLHFGFFQDNDGLLVRSDSAIALWNLE
jgi:hypothetical protein